jgi:group I intron endonuclease
MASGIYQIVNMVNGKRYIGSAANFKRRWNLHLSDLKQNKHHSSKLQHAWNKYGGESFKFEIILECNKDELLSYEQLLFDEENPEYNILKVAGSPLGIKRSKETRLKMSLASKGKPKTEEHRINAANAQKGKVSSLKDIPRTEETKAKISKGNKGKVRTAENCEKIRLIVSNRSDETKTKMSNSHKDIKLSEERKLKMSKSQKLRRLNEKVLKEILTDWVCAL